MKRTSQSCVAYPISDEQKRLRIDGMTDDDELPKPAAGWVAHRDPTTYKAAPVPTIKAYKNPNFLSSPHARSFRMMAEYEETMQRLAANGIRATVQFFGSARALDREQYDEKHAMQVKALAAMKPGSDEHVAVTESLKKLESMEWMVPYLEKTRTLARRLTEWSIRSHLSRNASLNGVSRNKSLQNLLSAGDVSPSHVQVDINTNASAKKKSSDPRFQYLPHVTDLSQESSHGVKGGLYVCTGGAGGFMEAANRGAADVPGGRSIGMGISLPFETGLNPYVSPELAFEYHYFFTRKLCMAFNMQALVVAPGGFGTCDEMFEMMTLKQTGKMQSAMPIVLLGKEYWKKVINWDAFNEAGVINQRDVDELLFTDSVDEAFEHITKAIGSQGANSPNHDL